MFRFGAFIPLFVLFFSYVFGVASDSLGSYQIYVRILSVLIILLFLLFKNKINLSSLLSLLSVSFLFLFLYCFNDNELIFNFIYLAFFIFYVRNLEISREQFLFCSLVASVCVISVFIFYSLAVHVDLLKAVTIQGRTRYYFGFSNPNKIGIVAYSFIVLASMVSSFRHKLRFVCKVLALISFFLMYLSDSRTALAATALFFLITILPSSFNFKRLLFLTPTLFVFISFIIAGFHSDNLVNKLFSNRPTDYYEFISNVNFFGYIFGYDTTSFRIDNSYLLAYYSIGPFVIILFSIVLFVNSKFIQYRYDLAFLSSFFVYGLMEGVLVRVEFPIVMCFYCLIFIFFKKEFYKGFIGKSSYELTCQV